MSPHTFLVAIVGFAIINGIFSPAIVAVVPVMILLAPGILVGSIAIVFFFSALVLSTATLIVSGIPAALYERYATGGQSSETSMWIWLVASAIITLPAVLNAASLTL